MKPLSRRAYALAAIALGVVLFVAVMPIMWINIRRMQREQVS